MYTDMNDWYRIAASVMSPSITHEASSLAYASHKTRYSNPVDDMKKQASILLYYFYNLATQDRLPDSTEHFQPPFLKPNCMYHVIILHNYIIGYV